MSRKLEFFFLGRRKVIRNPFIYPPCGEYQASSAYAAWRGGVNGQPAVPTKAHGILANLNPRRLITSGSATTLVL